MHIVDSAPDGLMIDWEDGKSDQPVAHDCCCHCDLPLCFLAACDCGLPKYEEHEGSEDCLAGR